jgi:hypothetical protein
MNLAEEFFFKGYTSLLIKNSPTKERLLASISAAHNGDFDLEKFCWKSKYPGTEDFRESAFDYSSSFIDILFENNIPELINKATNGRRVTLSHVQLRRSYPGNSYMDWHRDNYLDNEKKIGPFPPSVKIIFYPFREGEDCLKVIPGSHIRFFENKKQDSEINSKFPFQTIKGSNDYITLFDTSVWHSAVNGKNEKGSIRVIYSFTNKDQYLENFSQQEIHQRINNYYEQKLH